MVCVNKSKSKKGYAMAIAIVAGIVIVSLSAALLISINNEIIINKRTKEKIIVKKLAEAGIEEAFYFYNDKLVNLQPTEKEPEPQVENFNGTGSVNGVGDYEYSYSNIDKDRKIGRVISRAIVSGEDKYVISLEFSLEDGKILNREERN